MYQGSMGALDSPDWKTEAYRRAIQILETDARGRGIVGNKLVPLDAQMEWGGTMAVGVLVGDESFVTKWKAAPRMELVNAPSGEWITGKGHAKLK